MDKLNAVIFDDAQIRQLIRDADFESVKYELVLEAWKDFILVVKNVLSNKAKN